MSEPRRLKGWASKAHAELAKYYLLLSEKQAVDERIEEQRRLCERAGVSFRFGTPHVEAHDHAYNCACGAVVVLGYPENTQKIATPIRCADCIAKAADAAEHDAAEEQMPPPSMREQPK